MGGLRLGGTTEVGEAADATSEGERPCPTDIGCDADIESYGLVSDNSGEVTESRMPNSRCVGRVKGST